MDNMQKTVQNNLIYLSGPHGSGKTSLAKVLETNNSKIFIPELYSRNLKCHTDTEYRQALKVAGRAIENFEYLEMAKNNPYKIILGNRCVYDVLAYNEVYRAKGWITDKNEWSRREYTQNFFLKENSAPYAIVLNPGFEVAKRHLESRWKKASRKWNEDDMEYCALACQKYESFKDAKSILYIAKEVNLESKEEINRINNWIMEKYLQC